MSTSHEKPKIDLRNKLKKAIGVPLVIAAASLAPVPAQAKEQIPKSVIKHRVEQFTAMLNTGQPLQMFLGRSVRAESIKTGGVNYTSSSNGGVKMPHQGVSQRERVTDLPFVIPLDQPSRILEDGDLTGNNVAYVRPALGKDGSTHLKLLGTFNADTTRLIPEDTSHQLTYVWFPQDQQGHIDLNNPQTSNDGRVIHGTPFNRPLMIGAEFLAQPGDSRIFDVQR
jgi:hypothetical protein